jgi:tetratricopeptide (TPR) repeat protein
VAISLQPDATRDDLFEALGYANQATVEQPDFAPAHVQLGQLFASLAIGEDRRVDVVELRRAIACFEQALAVDPSNADAAQALTEVRQLLQSILPSNEP